jgi:hypothetical protein
MVRRRILVSLCCLVSIGVAVIVVAEEYATEAPAGFTTPTLAENPGSQSVSNGIAEPLGDSFAFDQALSIWAGTED